MNHVLFYFGLVFLGLMPLLYNFGKWCLKENGEWGRIAEALVTLAAKLQEYGLDLIPDLLRKIAVRNLAGAWKDVQDIVRLFEMSPDAVLKVFDKAFTRVLAHKLTDPAAVALLAAQVTAAQAKLPKAFDPAATGGLSAAAA